MSSVLRSPIKIIGGKGVLRRRILPYFPPHRCYVEPFGGGANLLLIKPLSVVEVYNDIDPRMVELFMTIKNDKKRTRLMEKLIMTPYSREERANGKEQWKQGKTQIERSRMFFVNSRQSMGGMLDRSSWGMVTNSSVDGMAQPISAYLKTIQMLPRIAERFKRVGISNNSWEDVIDVWDAPDTLFYLDPPYPKETRRDGWFDFEMTVQDHQRLVKKIRKLKGYVILSGYETDLYQDLVDNGWSMVKFDRSCNSAARTHHTQLRGRGVVKRNQKRVECLWLCPRLSKKSG